MATRRAAKAPKSRTAKGTGKTGGDLNLRQLKFVEEYLIDRNATQAAIRAGYSPKTAGSQGARLLKNAKISAAVSAGVDKASEKVALTVEYILGGLMEVADRCRQAVPVRDRQGKVVEGEWQFDANGATKALELLGKHKMLFPTRHEHTGRDGGPIAFDPGAAPEAVLDVLREISARPPA